MLARISPSCLPLHSYFATQHIDFALNTPLQVSDDRELGLFRGKAQGPALAGFSYTSTGGTYPVDFEFFDDQTKLNRMGRAYYKGGPYFVPDPDTHDPDYSYVPILRYRRQNGLLCPENSLAGVLTRNKKGMSCLTAFHIEVDPFLLSRSCLNDDELLDSLRESEQSQGRCRFFVNVLQKLGIDTIPIQFEEPSPNIHA